MPTFSWCCWSICKTSQTTEELNTRRTITKLKSSTQIACFTHQELYAATDSFKTVLGEGGFGAVYKGTLPASEQQGRLRPVDIAVKRLSVDSRQGLTEFEAEVKIFREVRHRNLVELLGWCLEKRAGSGHRHVMLVYKYVANKSLDYLLHKNQDMGSCNWARRFQILCEVAEALVYLHYDSAQATSILHRDIKPSNIMLDEGYHPKLGDFGLARKLEKGSPFYQTARVDAPMFGTKGYVAPELLVEDKFTKETDVYSFGVVLLEVATGKQPLHCVEGPGALYPARSFHNSTQPLVESVWDLHRWGYLLAAADKRLHHLYNETQMRRVLIAGLACCHPDPQARLTVKEASQVLTGAAELPCIPSVMPPPPHYQTEHPSAQRQYWRDIAFGSLDTKEGSTAAAATSDTTSTLYLTAPTSRTDRSGAKTMPTNIRPVGSRGDGSRR